MRSSLIHLWGAVDTAPALRQISAVVEFLFRGPEVTEPPERMAEFWVGVHARMAAPTRATGCAVSFSSRSTFEKDGAG